MSKIFLFSNSFSSVFPTYEKLFTSGDSLLKKPIQRLPSFTDQPIPTLQMINLFESLIAITEKLVELLVSSVRSSMLPNNISNSASTLDPQRIISDKNSTNSKSTSDSNEFLWKPRSDKSGKLVVLLPSSMSDNISGLRILSANSKTVLAVGKSAGTGNGERPHYRFDKPGGSFPDGSIVEITLLNGTVRRQVIKDTDTRFTKNGI